MCDILLKQTPNDDKLFTYKLATLIALEFLSLITIFSRLDDAENYLTPKKPLNNTHPFELRVLGALLTALKSEQFEDCYSYISLDNPSQSS